MKIFLLRTPAGDIVARTSLTELVDGNEAEYSHVAEFDITEGRLSADNPDVQRMLCDVFTEGALYQQEHPRRKVKKW
jgi:hypothetical protein